MITGNTGCVFAQSPLCYPVNGVGCGEQAVECASCACSLLSLFTMAPVSLGRESWMEMNVQKICAECVRCLRPLALMPHKNIIYLKNLEQTEPVSHVLYSEVWQIKGVCHMWDLLRKWMSLWQHRHRWPPLCIAGLRVYVCAKVRVHTMTLLSV